MRRPKTRTTLSSLALLCFAVATPGICQENDHAAPARFRYAPGDVLFAVEHVLQREIDERIGFAIARGHTVERRYTVLDVDEDGAADVLVEESAGPQRLHEYVVKERDQRDEHLARGFDAEVTVRNRVMRVRFTPTGFRSEPARDEPSVYYLQEIPELLAHALVLPGSGQDAFQHDVELPRMDATFAVEREGVAFEGAVAMTIRDPRVRDGAEVKCPTGTVRWELDPDLGLPRSWRIALRYPRFPIDRPNELVVTGELRRSRPLDAPELEALRADFEAFAAVRDAFFDGRFPAALSRAEEFASERQDSRLLPAVQAEVAAFRAQVPRYGERPPEPPVAASFGGSFEGFEALRGRVVVLDFWATWCKPCIAGMGHLIDAQATRPESLAVVGLTREDRQQSTADVRAFADSGYADSHDGVAVNYPLVVLGDDALHDWFEIRAIPKLVVLDKDGRIRWEQTGTGNVPRLDRILAAMLSE